MDCEQCINKQCKKRNKVFPCSYALWSLVAYILDYTLCSFVCYLVISVISLIYAVPRYVNWKTNTIVFVCCSCCCCSSTKLNFVYNESKTKSHYINFRAQLHKATLKRLSEIFCNHSLYSRGFSHVLLWMNRAKTD